MLWFSCCPILHPPCSSPLCALHTPSSLDAMHSNELAPWGHTPGDWWTTVFLDTFFPNLTKIDDSRPVWAACPASAWKSGVDSRGLPNGKPFVANYVKEPGAEAHSYWFALCATMDTCRYVDLDVRTAHVVQCRS
jgi:hypothetical protein